MVVAAAMVAAQAVAMAAVAVTLAAAIVVVMTVAMPAVIAALAVVTRAAVTVVEMLVASVLLIAHPVRMPPRQSLMLRHVQLIVRRWIVHVTVKIETLDLRQRSIVTRLRVVISPIVASVVLRRVKIALHVLALIVLLSMIVQIVRIGVGARSAAAQVIAIRVQLGAAMIAAHHVVNMLTQRLRSVANSHRVLSARIAPFMTSCRFSARRA